MIQLAAIETVGAVTTLAGELEVAVQELASVTNTLNSSPFTGDTAVAVAVLALLIVEAPLVVQLHEVAVAQLAVRVILLPGQTPKVVLLFVIVREGSAFTVTAVLAELEQVPSLTVTV